METLWRGVLALGVMAVGLAVAGCVQWRTDETRGGTREMTKTTEGFREEFVAGVGPVALRYGETVSEQETKRETVERVKVVTVQVPAVMGAVAATFGGSGMATTGVGVAGTLVAAGMAWWQRRKRVQAEQVAETVAALPPDEARKELRRRKGKA